MKKQTFESAIRRLEEIVDRLESGEILLDDALEKYEEGMKLVKFCEDKLNVTEKKLHQLMETDEERLEIKEFDE